MARQVTSASRILSHRFSKLQISELLPVPLWHEKSVQQDQLVTDCSLTE